MTPAMSNPWTALPTSSPYVIEADRAAIEQLNRQARDDHRIHTELLPEPFFGRRTAPVVLLALNPGFSEGDTDAHTRKDFLSACRGNLSHTTASYPFLYLDPRFEDTPGGAWWMQKLGPLLEAGVDRQTLASNLLCVEFFPYHSREYKSAGGYLASQAYGFRLVEDAIRREALIITMRSASLWHQAVPALASYRRQQSLSNPRNVTISRRNYKGDFVGLVSLLNTTYATP